MQFAVNVLPVDVVTFLLGHQVTTIGGRIQQHVVRRLLQRAIKHTFEHAIIALARLERQVIAEQHKALRQLVQLLDHTRQVAQVIAFDLDQTQTGRGVLGQQSADQGRLAGAARTPQQGMVGRQPVDELTGIAAQLIALQVDADQIGQACIQAHLQRHQVTAAAFLHPARGQCLRPVDRLAQRWQQRLQSGQHGVGALQKSIQPRIHGISLYLTD